MTNRERVLSAVAHKPPDRVPTDMWATPEILDRLIEHFQVDRYRGSFTPYISLNGGAVSCSHKSILRLWQILGIDGIFNVQPPYNGPKLEETKGILYNEWGFGFRKQKYKTGEYLEQVVYPMKELQTVSELKGYRWPDPDWYDYEALPELIEYCEGRAVSVGYTAIFYYHNMLRGLELSLTDPLLRPDFTHYLVERLSDFFQEYHGRCFEVAGRLIDITQVTDDFGSQQGLLISPEIFRSFYREPMRRAIDLAKSRGLFVFHHDDGDIRALLPELADMGIDILNPIQWRCGGWDLSALKRDFGGRICFHGGVDNQKTLPFGSPEEVRREAKMLMDTLGSDRTGYILCPCHNIQPNTPVENIIALYEVASQN